MLSSSLVDTKVLDRRFTIVPNQLVNLLPTLDIQNINLVVYFYTL